jgi:hypothetical protein
MVNVLAEYITRLRPIGGESLIGAWTADTEFVRYGIRWPADV